MIKKMVLLIFICAHVLFGYAQTKQQKDLHQLQSAQMALTLTDGWFWHPAITTHGDYRKTPLKYAI